MNSLRLATLLCGLMFTRASAQDLLINGDFESDPFDTGWVQLGATPFGGLAPGSAHCAALDSLERIGQDVSGIGPDWQLDFYFAIRNTTNRAFSLFVNTAGDATNTSAATINLRYQSGRFNAFAGGSFGTDLGLGTLDFSADENADGDFDDPGDVKKVYHMRITGNEWGSGASTYDIQLSNANETAFSRSVTGLSRYQNGSGHTAFPSAFLFNSAFGSNPGFWVDDVTFQNIDIPDDPNLTINTPLPVFGTLPLDATAPTTRTIVVQNTGFTSALTLTAGTFTGPDADKYALAATFPMSIPPGDSAALDVTFTPGAATGAFDATLNLASNDTSSPSIPVALPVRLFLTGDELLANGGFEATPSLTSWVPTGTATPVPGLASGSPTAVHLDGPGSGGAATTLGQSVTGTPDWQLTFDLAIPEITGRAFQVYVHNFGEATRLTDTAINLRYENDVFSVLNGNVWIDLPELGGLLPSTDSNGDGDYDDDGDTKNLYRLRLTGRDWGTPEADYQIETTGANSPLFTGSAGRLTYRPAGLGHAVNSPPASIIFVSAFGNSPGYTIDNVSLTAGAPPRAAVFEPAGITLDNGGITLTWDADFISTYRIWTSPDLRTWTMLDGGLPGPEYRDMLTPGTPVRFYRVEKE